VKALWTFLFIFMATVNAGEAKEGENLRMFSSYGPADSGQNLSIFKELKPGEALLPGNYSIKAKLSLKSEKKKFVLESLDFEWPDNSRSQNKMFQRGWTSYDKTYFWNPGKRENVLTIPLSLNSTDKDISITDFDELRIDYQDLILENPSNLSVQLLVSGKKSGKTISILAGLGGKNQPTLVKKLDLTPMTWREKDHYYLAKRALRLPFENTWRYSRSGVDTVFQRRFHLSLDSFDTIDLVLQPGTTEKQIESLVCNFRIGFGSFLKPQKMLAWNSVPKKILNFEGQKVIRVDLGQYIRKKYGQSTGTHLKEMIFFFPGNTSKVLRTFILKEINFLAPGKFLLKSVEAINAKGAQWKPKDSSYTVNQLFERPIDTTRWYSADGPNTLFHRRFNKDLSLIETIDFAFSPKIDATRVKLDLRIGSDTVEWEEELPRRLIVENGKSVLRIQIGELLRKKYAKKDKIFLKEVVISIPKKNAIATQNSPLEKIVFQSLVGVENKDIEKDIDSPKRINHVLRLSSRIENLAQTKKRLVINMKILQDKLNWGAKLHSMTLIVRPQNPKSTAAFNLQNARAVSLWEKEQPVFLDTEKPLLSRWGGPFLDLGDEDQNVEWPRVHAYLTFYKRKQEGLPQIFDEKQKKNIGVKTGNENPNGLINLSTDEKIDNSTGKKVNLLKGKRIDSIVRFRGATIRVHPFLSSWSSEPHGLVLEGEEGGWIEIDWPVQAQILKGTRFFFGISEGAENIRSMQMILSFRGQPLKEVSVLPNRVFQIDVSTREIDGLKVRMKLRKNPFKLKLEEMAVFQPVAVTHAQALDIPINKWDKTPLIPKDVISPSEMRVSINQGNLKAIMFPKGNSPITLTWTTDMNRKVGWIQSVKINYQVPPAMIANHPCWLQLTLVSSNHQTKQKVCPQLPSGQMTIAADDLFRGTQIPSNEVIKSINWEVNFKDFTDSTQQPLNFFMAMAVEGTNFISLRKELTRHPVLGWQGQKIFPTSLADSSAIDLLSGRNLVDLGNLTVKNFSEANQALKLFDHPHLNIQTVVFERSDPISQKLWESFMETDQNDTSDLMTSLSGLFLPLMVFGLLWWGWKKKWHKFIWKWQKQLRVLFWGRIKPIFQRFPRATQNKGFLLNRALGLVLIAPGLLSAGWFWEVGTGIFVLETIIVFIIGVLWHELRWWFSASQKMVSKTNEADDLGTSPTANQRWKNDSPFKIWMFGENKEFPQFLYLITTVALGWMNFNLGHGNDLVLSLLPILGVIYLYLPWLFKGKMRSWISTATGLYLMGIFGLIIKWRGGADFFFTFAGIAAVLVWKNFSPHLRPKLEQHWPSLSEKVYGGAGTYYIAGFILTLVMATFFLIIKLEPVAEQIAVVGYYMLLIGVFLEIKYLRNKNHEQHGEDKMITTGEDASRA